MGEDLPSFQKNESRADQGYEDDVGIVFLLEGEADQRAQRCPKRRQARSDQKSETGTSHGSAEAASRHAYRAAFLPQAEVCSEGERRSSWPPAFSKGWGSGTGVPDISSR